MNPPRELTEAEVAEFFRRIAFERRKHECAKANIALLRPVVKAKRKAVVG